MKKILIPVVLFLNTGLAFCQIPDALAANSYQLDFIFAGKNQNTNDSVFALQYTFPSLLKTRFKSIVLEDSHLRQQFDLSKKQANVEILNQSDKMKLTIYQYDKYDLPIPVQAEDISGSKHFLYLLDRNGSYMTSDQFKKKMKTIRETAMQHNE